MSAAATRGLFPAPARPFRLTPPEPLEADLHANVVMVLEKLLAPPAVFWSSGIGAAQLSPHQAAAFSRAGIKRGLPDLFILRDRLYGIELKRKGGTLSKTKIVHTKRGSPRILVGQVERFAELEAAGMPPIAICKSVDEVLAQLAAWQIPLRGRAS